MDHSQHSWLIKSSTVHMRAHPETRSQQGNYPANKQDFHSRTSHRHGERAAWQNTHREQQKAQKKSILAALRRRKCTFAEVFSVWSVFWSTCRVKPHSLALWLMVGNRNILQPEICVTLKRDTIFCSCHIHLISSGSLRTMRLWFGRIVQGSKLFIVFT